MADMDLLKKPFPVNVLKRRKIGGQNGREVPYLPGEVAIARLNEACHDDWTMEVKRVDYKEITTQTDRGIHRSTLLIVIVALTVPGHGTREGIGVQMVPERGGEDLYKGALTDGLKKAATLFGMGLELYDDDDGAAARREDAQNEPRSNQQQAQAQYQQRQASNHPPAPSNAPEAPKTSVGDDSQDDSDLRPNESDHKRFVSWATSMGFPASDLNMLVRDGFKNTLPNITRGQMRDLGIQIREAPESTRVWLDGLICALPHKKPSDSQFRMMMATIREKNPHKDLDPMDVFHQFIWERWDKESAKDLSELMCSKVIDMYKTDNFPRITKPIAQQQRMDATEYDQQFGEPPF